MRFFIGIIVVCLLGSCASIGKGIFTKRKYNRGYYIGVASAKRSISKPAAQKAKKDVASEKNEIVVFTSGKKDEAEPDNNSIKKEKIEWEKNNTPVLNYSKEEKINLIIGPSAGMKNKIDEHIEEADDSLATKKFLIYTAMFIVLTLLYAYIIFRYSKGLSLTVIFLLAMLSAFITLFSGLIRR